MKTRLSLSLLIPAFLLLGCSLGRSAEEVRPTPIVPAAAEGGGSADEGGGVGNAISLRLWAQQNDALIAAYRALADAYQAANPGVAIAVEPIDSATYDQLIQNGLTSGTAADIIHLAGGSVCALAPNLAPVPEHITNLAGAQSLFQQAPLDTFVCDGVLVGLPLESTTPAGLGISRTSLAQEVAWDFARFVALDPENAAQWNATAGTAPAFR